MKGKGKEWKERTIRRKGKKKRTEETIRRDAKEARQIRAGRKEGC